MLSDGAADHAACVVWRNIPPVAPCSTRWQPDLRGQRLAAVAGVLRIVASSRYKDLLRLAISAFRAEARTRATARAFKTERQHGVITSAHVLNIALRDDQVWLLRNCWLGWRRSISMSDVERKLEHMERWGKECQTEAADLRMRSIMAEKIAREAEAELRRRSAEEFNRLRDLEAELRDLQFETTASAFPQAAMASTLICGGKGHSADSSFELQKEASNRIGTSASTSGTLGCRIWLRVVFVAWYSVKQQTWLLQSLLSESIASERQISCVRAIVAWRFATDRGRLVEMAAQSFGPRLKYPCRPGLGNAMCRALARIVMRVWSNGFACENSSAGQLVEASGPGHAAAHVAAHAVAEEAASLTPALFAKALPLFGTPRRVRGTGGTGSEARLFAPGEAYLAHATQYDFLTISSH